MAIDISKHRTLLSNELHLRDANDELMYAEHDKDGAPIKESAVVAVIYGPGSKQWAKVQQRKNNAGIDRLKKKGKADQTAAESLEERAENLAGITKEFRNLAYGELQGEAMIKAVYLDPLIGYIADQVDRFANDWANFSMPSASV